MVSYSSAAKSDNANKITSVYLLPKFQGKGIGTMLLQQALDWLGNEKDVTLGVVPYNQSAIRFYEKSGFQLREPIQHDQPTFATGKDMAEVKMVRAKL